MSSCTSVLILGAYCTISAVCGGTTDLGQMNACLAEAGLA